MAVVLAEGVAGTTSQFVQMMNAAAQRLGMTATRFVNPNGLHNPQQVSSARDIAILAAAAFNEFPEHRHYYRQDFMTLGKRRLRNRNSLLRLMASADGMKTGFTCPAGFNLVATASENGRRLMAVVLGAASGRSRAEWAHRLLASGFTTNPSPLRLSQIANQPVNMLATTDMSSEACGRGRGIPLTPTSGLKGYGVSLGSYQTRSDAKQVLDIWKNDPAAPLKDISTGIVQVANPGGFAAVAFDIDQPRAETLCARLKTRAAYCAVMTPETFSTMAAEAKAKAPPRKRKRKKK
jgi:D-alanyl-D-alanine carboxypeptidase